MNYCFKSNLILSDISSQIRHLITFLFIKYPLSRKSASCNAEVLSLGALHWLHSVMSNISGSIQHRFSSLNADQSYRFLCLFLMLENFILQYRCKHFSHTWCLIYPKITFCTCNISLHKIKARTWPEMHLTSNNPGEIYKPIIASTRVECLLPSLVLRIMLSWKVVMLKIKSKKIHYLAVFIILLFHLWYYI